LVLKAEFSLVVNSDKQGGFLIGWMGEGIGGKQKPLQKKRF
jgi:hypothetical protein